MKSIFSPTLTPRRAGLSLGLLSSLLLASCAATTPNVQEGDHPVEGVAVQEADAIKTDEMMAAWLAASAPGEAHAAMATQAGKWDVKGKMYMAPGTEPMPMNATAETEIIFGGRYAIERFHSEFMGMPFEGMLIQGYDNLTERHWNLWLDNMGTRYMPSFGNINEEGLLELHGTNYDLMTPEGRPNRTLIQTHSDDHVTMQMFDSLEDGSEWMTMELHYKRGM